jgi:hypothetical protein
MKETPLAMDFLLCQGTRRGSCERLQERLIGLEFWHNFFLREPAPDSTVDMAPALINVT